MYQSGCTDARPTEACSAPVVDASRDFYLIFSPNEQCRGGGGGMLPDVFVCSLFPVQQTTSGMFFVFFGLALNVRNNKV